MSNYKFTLRDLVAFPFVMSALLLLWLGIFIGSAFTASLFERWFSDKSKRGK